jgi:hypothetical protein
MDSSLAPLAYMRHLQFIWSRWRPLQNGARDPSNPERASKHPYDWALSCDDYFSMNWGIGHLDVIIIFLGIEALST